MCTSRSCEIIRTRISVLWKEINTADIPHIDIFLLQNSCRIMINSCHSTLIDVTYKLQTVSDRWMWLKSYKPFKNCEWNVSRELLENWKTLARDINAIPLCSTLEYALGTRATDVVFHFVRQTLFQNTAYLSIEFQNWEIYYIFQKKSGARIKVRKVI